MIFQFFIDFAVNLFCGLFSLLDFINIPIDVISTLATITSYGTWIIGSDVALMFCGSVSFWLTFKLSVGVVKFIWQLLPLTQVGF